ncbi:MAG: hypothetical protein C0481_03860 [Phenylobacterium sp.]|uniref:transporter n=1 Tax=Phenylobacterium sp. TaxID=1871053 RepID=UPI0025F46E44|nr:transporter [Phenylobacterium sp.]MBA4010979.1 hypothetical protein [Phenylobacterium sp.]
MLSIQRTTAFIGGLAAIAAAAWPASAQELEPRSYSPSPVGTNFVVAAYGQSSGEVVFDAGAPISDAQADINLATIAYSKVIDIGGHQSSVLIAVPYMWGDATGNLREASRSISRSGLGDMRLKFSTMLIGGPALSPEPFANRKPQPVVGVSLLAVAPTGEYMPNKLVNIGANRWAFKPEIGASAPFGRWQVDAYAGVWLYGDNENFLGLRQERRPMGTFQAHISYTFKPGLWAALNTTYYVGGDTVVGGRLEANRQENARIGATVSVPIAQRQSLLFSYSQGTLTRYGGDFTSFALSWRALWFD